MRRGVSTEGRIRRRGNTPARLCAGVLLTGAFGFLFTGLAGQTSDSLTAATADSLTSAAAGAERRLDAAPGMYRYDRETIEKSGYFTLSQLAGIAPGFSAIPGPYAQDLLVSRGSATRYGGRQIVTIDGIPVNGSIERSVPIGWELPLFFADRVEFQAGPQALLHGDGGLGGVIDIVTARPASDGVIASASMGGGVESGTPAEIRSRTREALVHRNPWGGFSFSRWGGAEVAARQPDKEIRFAFGYHASEATLEYGQPSEPGTAVSAKNRPWGPYKNDRVSYFGRFQGRLTDGVLDGLGVGFIGLFRETGYGLAWVPQSAKPSVSNSFKAATVIPYFRFDRHLGKRLRLNSSARWNYSQDHGWQENDAGYWAPADSNGVATYGLAVSDFSLTASCTIDSIGPLSLVAGIAFDRQRFDTAQTWVMQPQNNNGPAAADSLPISGGALYTYSAFVMARGVAPLLHGLIATAGLRLDNANWKSATWHQVLPSASLALKTTPWLNIKASYATGFLAPTLRSYAWNDVKRVAIDEYNRDFGQDLRLAPLHPELQHTLQGGLAYDNGMFSADAQLFYSLGGNRIERQPFFGASLPGFEQNSRSAVYCRGSELQVRWHPLGRLQLLAGVEYARTWGRYGGNDFLPDGSVAAADTLVADIQPHVSRVKGYLCVDYTAPGGLQAFAAFKGVRPAPWLNRNREPDIWLLDVNLTQPIGKVFSISLNGANLLNIQHYSFHGAVPASNRMIGLSVKTRLFP